MNANDPAIRDRGAKAATIADEATDLVRLGAPYFLLPALLLAAIWASLMLPL